MINLPSPHWWSWADIVRHADQLGIPNFQRGAVWEASNRVALLESIYEQSPCGTFVFWAPDSDDLDPHRHGVPLRGFSTVKLPMWLVDGQQRTRTMLDTFHQLIEDSSRPDGWSPVRDADAVALRVLGSTLLGSNRSADASDDAEDDLHLWVVVLPAMRAFDRGKEPYFGRHSESRNVQRGSMFRQLKPRARAELNADGKVRPVPPLPVGTVPLATLLSPVGVFHDAALRNAAENALRTFGEDDNELTHLDELLPWGPQFVTGHACEASVQDGTPPAPIRWSDIHARR
jgi:hypothetical protein